MNWKKAIGFGILIWICIVVVFYISRFVFVYSGLASFGWTGAGIFEFIVLLICSLVVYWIVKKFFVPENNNAAIKYGLVFFAVGIFLDYFVMTVSIFGNQPGYNEVGLLFSTHLPAIIYFAVVFVPLLVATKFSQTLAQ
jgi:hypothetical protein